MLRAKAYAILGAALLLTGCADPGQDDLRKQVSEQNKKLETLQKDVEAMKNKQSWDDTVRDWDKVAYLTPGSEGYSIIKNDYGVITVSLRDVTAYANGSRVTLRFGNVTNAALDDVKATIDWGQVDAKGSPLNQEAKSREVAFDKPLRPGRWTSIDVVLEGTPPSNVGFVRVHDVSNKGIILLTEP